MDKTSTSITSHGPLSGSLENFEKNGYIYISDAVVGKEVEKMVNDGFPTDEEDGFVFCKRRIIDDKRVCDVIQHLFKPAGLGCIKAIGPYPGHSYCFFNNTGSGEIKALMVHLWRSKSKISLYEGSHLHNLKAQRPKREEDIGVLKVPQTALSQYEKIEADLEAGGITIQDARLAFTVEQGVGIYYGFGTLEEIEQWPKIPLPNSSALEQLAAILKMKGIELNFKPVDKARRLRGVRNTMGVGKA